MDSASVLEIFKEITRIPRESGHEGPITAYLQQWAAAHHLDCKTDPTGNVLISRPASKGKEHVPAIVLQAHQDMVCEKNAGVEHDFARDPIPYVIEDGWMIAKDTTLGADDGIGIAACLALLESELPTGPLECLFTISEETGMDGAEALQSGFFEGKTLINLDSEDEGQLFIGCAGGLSTLVRFELRREAVRRGWKKLQLGISGGVGGHSGDDINKDRANTVQQLARFLCSELPHGLQLIGIQGGGKHNAIAREASALVAVPDPRATRERFAAFGQALSEEFHVTEPELACKASAGSSRERAIRGADRIIRALFACPHGPLAMSQDIPGLVETSTNLASVRIAGETLEIVTSQRSPMQSERRMAAAKVAACFQLAGAQVEHTLEYPGWTPNVQSPILKQCVEAYRTLFNTEPEVKAIHAGLECGLFLTKFPGLDMISFGPTLRGVHAPGEKLELASLDKFVKLLNHVVCHFK
ncbi:MAG: aminoacyl-histidine dipeptidase [Bacteroidales bacterium]|nr:aminoacyl-histidine dipeptidase [Bacteroidales bacterium]